METEQVNDASDELHLFTIDTSLKPKPLTYEVITEGSSLVMEVDTGAEFSIISVNTRPKQYSQHCSQSNPVCCLKRILMR